MTNNSRGRRILTALLPEGWRSLQRRVRAKRKERRIDEYWRAIPPDTIHHAIDNAIEQIGGLTDAQLTDGVYLERELIPSLGLNNEQCQEQPPHLSDYFGKGLHIWQYPNQFGPFLAWLARDSINVRKYLEIGVRWGGTFIVVSEFLRRLSPCFQKSIAIDPIPPSPLMRRYLELGRAEYRQCCSTEAVFARMLDSERPDFVFIDGDHSLVGVMHDFDICSDVANFIAFHDVSSDGCPDTTKMWNFLRRHAKEFSPSEFSAQYKSVPGNFMGIGVLVRK
jgi:hypothetical protein